MSSRANKVAKGVAETVEVHASSGNVYADLGLPNPEVRAAKSQLAMEIGRIVKSQRLTQAQAAKLLGIDQPNMSRLVRGQLAGFSTERLIGFLNALGRGIDIRIHDVRDDGPRLRVLVEA